MRTAGRKSVGIDLTEGSVFQNLLIFVGPIILANIIQQLYSLVDLLVIGQFVGNAGTVGVSVGGEVSDILTPVATAFGAAGQIYIGQLAGAREKKKMQEAIGTLLSLMFLASIGFAVISILFRKQILTLINCPEEAFSQATAYLVLTATGLPFIFGYNAVTGVLRGLGESKRPLLFIVIAAVVNIFLDLLLVGPFHMEAAGTAIATSLSQGASFLAAFIYMYRNREQFEFEFRPSYFQVKAQPAKVILGLGLPQAARSLFVRFSMLYVNASVNAYGITESATNSVGNKLQKFLEVFSTSYSQAASAMVAQNLGAKKPERARKTIHYSCLSSVAVAVLMTVVLLFWPRQVFGIFTRDPAVMDMGVVYLRIMIIHMFLSAVTSTYQAMVIGCGNASLNFVIGILDGVVCKVGLSLLFVHAFRMGVYGFFWGTGLSRLLPAVIVVTYFYSRRWEHRKLLTEE